MIINYLIQPSRPPARRPAPPHFPGVCANVARYLWTPSHSLGDDPRNCCMIANVGDKVRVCLILKPTKVEIAFNPRPESRDFDVTQCGRFSLTKEVIVQCSPAEERAKTILEELEREGRISLSIQTISTKGFRGFLNRNKMSSVICHKNDNELVLVIDETIDKSKLYDFIGL